MESVISHRALITLRIPRFSRPEYQEQNRIDSATFYENAERPEDVIVRYQRTLRRLAKKQVRLGRRGPRLLGFRAIGRAVSNAADSGRT